MKKIRVARFDVTLKKKAGRGSIDADVAKELWDIMQLWAEKRGYKIAINLIPEEVLELDKEESKKAKKGPNPKESFVF